jgi:hypothetical protein
MQPTPRGKCVPPLPRAPISVHVHVEVILVVHVLGTLCRRVHEYSLSPLPPLFLRHGEKQSREILTIIIDYLERLRIDLYKCSEDAMATGGSILGTSISSVAVRPCIVKSS